MPTLQSRSIPGDGESLKRPEQAKSITRVAVKYAIHDGMGRADVSYCYPLGTHILMADGKVLPVEWLKAGMQFRLEEGGFATVTGIEEPRIWELPSEEKNAAGNSLCRIVGTIKYTGYAPRVDLGIGGEILKTTPDHLFWSVTRKSWEPASTFRIGELLRNNKNRPVPVTSISPVRMEFCELHNFEVEACHTYFVGRNGIWTHNGLGDGCRVPRAAEAKETLARGPVSSRHYSESTTGTRLHQEAQAYRATHPDGSNHHRNFATAEVTVDGKTKTVKFYNDPGGLHSEQRLVAWHDLMVSRGRTIEVHAVYSERPPCGPWSANCADTLGNRYGAFLDVWHGDR